LTSLEAKFCLELASRFRIRTDLGSVQASDKRVSEASEVAVVVASGSEHTLWVERPVETD
jgi:hypothetical protein